MELEDPLALEETLNTYFSVDVPVEAVLEDKSTSGTEFKVKLQQEQALPMASFKTLPDPVEVKKMAAEKKGIPPGSKSNTVSKIFLGNIMSIASTESQCCVCHQTDKQSRSCIPQTAKMHFWLTERIWIPSRNRCCGNHLEVINGKKIFSKDAVKTLKEHKKVGATLNSHEVEKCMNSLADQINEKETRRH